MKQHELEIFDCAQGTSEWLELRRGIPTTSNFGTILAAGDGMDTYLRRLAGEIITGELAEQDFVSLAMERGKMMESGIREYYDAFVAAEETRIVGFCRRGPVGCSPDLLVGENGMAEFKSMKPELLFLELEKAERKPGYFPPKFLAQCQGGMWVTGRQWCDLVVSYPRMPKIYARITRDDAYIDKLANAVMSFELRLRRYVEKWSKA